MVLALCQNVQEGQDNMNNQLIEFVQTEQDHLLALIWLFWVMFWLCSGANRS